MSRKYSNTAVQTSLDAGLTDAATTLTVASTTGFPAVDFVLALDAEQANQELVLVTNVAGTTLTVTRGYDNTTAVAHDAGAVVRHSHAAIDFKDSRDHEDATEAHGATGAVVGTTNAQALTNKDLSSGTNTFPSILATDAEVTAAVDAAAATAASDLTAHADDTSTHGVATVAGLAEAQTLTNKTIALGSNSVSGTTAQFNAANSDGNFATLAGVETLTDKTLTAPVITAPTVSGAASFSGSVAMDKKLQGGQDSINVSDSADTTKVITFDTAFDATPTVQVGPVNGSPSFYFVWVESATTTTFTLKSRKAGASGASSISVNWTATARTQ